MAVNAHCRPERIVSALVEQSARVQSGRRRLVGATAGMSRRQFEQELVMATTGIDDTSRTFASGPRSPALSAVLARNWWAIAIRGVLGIAVGAIALVLPAATILALVLLFAAYMLIDGVFAIIAAVRAARQHDRWGLLVLEGLADIVAGAIAVLWPAITVIAFVLLIAAWALVSGMLMLMAAFRLNIDHGRWWLAFGGAASIIFGVLLLVAPLIGALVLTWWFGAYALIFGITLLVLAFRLKARHDERPQAAAARGVT
jgi:uncharacterized membrane protein HdeD (DUF308 family)